MADLTQRQQAAQAAREVIEKEISEEPEITAWLDCIPPNGAPFESFVSIRVHSWLKLLWVQRIFGTLPA